MFHVIMVVKSQHFGGRAATHLDLGQFQLMKEGQGGSNTNEAIKDSQMKVVRMKLVVVA